MVASIGTTEQFKKALLRVRDKGLPPAHLAMLRAHCRAPDSTITPTKLAEAAEYENYNGADLQYGLLARAIAEQLSYTPTTRKDGSGMWWTTLSYSIDGATEADTGHFQFIMRPELVSALREMRWA